MELEDLLGQAVTQFCYPYGEFNALHARLAAQAGYVAATTTQRSRESVGARSPQAWFELSRVPIVRSTHWPQFLLKLLSRYEDRHAQAPKTSTEAAS
jgi:peptidoglycan/xylan/chitin deacetylase (PgdA/CDA1 family)